MEYGNYHYNYTAEIHAIINHFKLVSIIRGLKIYIKSGNFFGKLCQKLFHIIYFYTHLVD